MKIIAEVGSNWKSLDDCLMSIKKAKECGADVVKFQYFNKFEMTGGSKVYDVSTPHLPTNWIPKLAEYAHTCGIEFMCTAFSAEGYELVNNFVQTHKIASAEITDLNILDKVNSFKRPVYLSTGGATIEQIDQALSHLKDCPVTIMCCVTAYPARVVDFRHLQNLKEEFGTEYLYGYSDHSTDVLNIPKLAQNYGCSVIEKHVNFTSHTDTDDAPHSLSTEEFALMVRNIRGEDIPLKDTFTPCTWQRRLIGDGYYRPRGDEADGGI